jgi:hypothetical protein
MSGSSGSDRFENAVWFAKGAAPEDCARAFEAYGHAMAAASAFEMLMVLMIMKAVVLKLDKRAGTRIQPADRSRLVQKLMRSSYDRLQREIRLSFTISAELQQGLADGKDARDHLAHNFWSGQVSNLFSSEGVDVIAANCAVHAHHFRLLSEALIEEAGVNADDYVQMLLTDPERADKLEGWRSVLREHGVV